MSETNLKNVSNEAKVQNRFCIISASDGSVLKPGEKELKKKNYTFHEDFDKPVVLVFDEDKDFTDCDLRERFDLSDLD